MEEQQVIEEGGVSLKEIFKTIWLRKWFTLAVAVAVFLVCAIVLFYGYNPSKKYYEMKFSLNLPGTVNGSTYVLPDGTQFYYTDFVSENTLQTVKDSNSEFSDIDVASMAKSGNISIERTAVTTDSETVYTLSVKSKYFDDESQAKEFLMSLADAPMRYLKGMVIDYAVYLPIAESAIDYETEIGFLKSQLEVVQNQYDKLITVYGGSFVGDESGKTLLAYSQEVKAYSDSGVLDNLISKLRTGKIIKSEECENYYLNMIETLTRDYEIKKNTLASIMKTSESSDGSVIINIDPSVLALAQEVAELDKQIEALNNYNGGTVDGSYQGVADAFKTVSDLTGTLTAICANVYNKASSVVYVQSGILNTTGGFGLVMIVLISLVLAAIIALIAGYVAGKIKLSATNNTKNEGDNTSSVTSFKEANEEAAADSKE